MKNLRNIYDENIKKIISESNQKMMEFIEKHNKEVKELRKIIN